ncbi:alpha/beta fold hydrolase [Nonlabens ponticola]|uniref:Alpha/beta fold hydrolase n=1 Tax=Nonlabens ponticola TaxID=2496866 RepID=A0A3S9MZH2_9FLAO|nr:alpha/beta fold hydrolase [Nonlabens ponticola]AZQ44463.1 alpha/beta fold hydrolase [Nonlabens ponticola]
MKKYVKLIGIVWILAGFSFFVYMYFTFMAQGVNADVHSDTKVVSVTRSSNFDLFEPNENSKGTIFFFPGALVDPAAYAPICRELSLNNYKTYLIHMPWRMASLGYQSILEDSLIVKEENNILIGHSQGAKMAAQFTQEHPELINGLVLLGTTHPRDYALTANDVQVLKIYGGNDQVAPVDKVLLNKVNLPEHTIYEEIDGGNHSQFGHYGQQIGDGSASISREKQQEKTINHILQFLENL